MKILYFIAALAFFVLPTNVNAFSSSLNSVSWDGYIWVQPYSVNGVVTYDYFGEHFQKVREREERDIFQAWASESRLSRYVIQKPNMAICLFRGTC